MQARGQKMNTVDAAASFAGAYTYMPLCMYITLYYTCVYSILRMHKRKIFLCQVQKNKKVNYVMCYLTPQKTSCMYIYGKERALITIVLFVDDIMRLQLFKQSQKQPDMPHYREDSRVVEVCGPLQKKNSQKWNAP